MAEVTIKYTNPKTLKILKDLSKFLDFVVSPSKTPRRNESNKEEVVINSVKIVRSGGSSNNKEMNEILTRNNINAKELRAKAWQRNK